MSPDIRYIALSKRSRDAFAQKIRRVGRIFPHEVLKVAVFLDFGSSRSWWYPCLRSSFGKTVQSCNLYMKSPTIVPWVVLCLSMTWLGTLRSTIALIMCGSHPSRNVERLATRTFFYLWKQKKSQRISTFP